MFKRGDRVIWSEHGHEENKHPGVVKLGPFSIQDQPYLFYVVLLDEAVSTTEHDHQRLHSLAGDVIALEPEVRKIGAKVWGGAWTSPISNREFLILWPGYKSGINEVMYGPVGYFRVKDYRRTSFAPMTPVTTFFDKVQAEAYLSKELGEDIFLVV